MSDDRYKPRIRSAYDAGKANRESGVQFSYNREKLEQENRYRVQGQAFPKKIQCFNWGACILSPVWGLFNNSPMACLGLLLSFIPYLGIILGILFSLYCGAKGNEWAWENKEWQSLEHFHSVQRSWALAGVVLELILIVGISVFAFTALSYIQNTDILDSIL